MENHPKISVVIVSWNVAGSLKRCLESVRSAKYPELELIVIDNASTDESVLRIKSFKTLNIKLIKNENNIGFPKAVNQGLKQSTGDFVLLLNPDTRLPGDFFMDCLDFFTDHPTAGIMGPKLVNTDGSPQGSVFHESTVSAVIWEFWLGQSGLTGKYVPDENKPVVVDAVSGACMFFPRKTLDLVGLFTEKVFMYFEDLDYCRRIRQANLRVYFNPQISVIHEHGMSSAQTSREKYRNFIESLIYPFRKLFNYPNQIQSFQRYQTEAGIWYHGWMKHTLMAGIIWSGQKLRRVNPKS